MPLTATQTLITILCVAAGTILTRFSPFLLFPEHRKQPKVVEYLSTMIPAAMMGLLVVYCLKDMTPLQYPYALPELIAIAVIVVLHLWRRNVLLSLGAGTVVYMLLVQLVFA